MNSLRNLIIPVVFLVLICLASFSYFIITTSKNSDIRSVEVEKRILKTSIVAIADNVALISENTAWWTAAYDNIVTEFDAEWVKDNADGIWVTDSFSRVNVSIQGVFIVKPDNEILYKSPVLTLPDPILFLQNGLSDLLETLTVDDFITPKSISAIQFVNNKVYALGISLIQKSTVIDNLKIPAERRPALVFVTELKDEDIVAVGNSIAIDDLHIGYIPDSNYFQINIASEFSEKFIGTKQNIYIGWTPPTPGTDLLNTIKWPSLIILTIFLITLLWFYYNARQIIDNLHKASNIKSNFLANMSHEIRTPLNAIIGFTDMLKGEYFGKIEGTKNKEYLSFIKSSSGHLLSLINDILDLSRVESGQVAISLENFNTSIAINQCISTVEQFANKKNISIETDLSEIMIESDLKLVKQAIINIITNAIKFTADNGMINIKNYNNNTNTIIDISDNGIGMEQEEIEVALEQFGQIQSVYTRNHDGTGLGLPLVSKYMKALGGRMEVKSQKGIGTTISLIFLSG